MFPLAATPESEGVSSARLADFVDRFFALKWTHGLVVLRHGRVVAECYRGLCSPADRHQLFSLSKSFTSSAVGIALGEGLIPSLDAPLVSFFPEFDSPKVADRMRRVTLRHLLSMGMGRASCGLWGDRYDRLRREFAEAHGADMRAVAERFASGLEFFGDGEPVVKHLLEDELRDEPGSRFEYNTGATFLLSAVLQKVAGRRLPDYLRTRLFDPLGIARDVVWDDLPGSGGIALGGAGLNLTVREIAAAGDLWLRGGILRDGRRLIPAAYMAEATAKRIDNAGPGRNPEWSQGYGYQFWRCRHGAFRGDGASGQLAVMLPEQDAVVAATAGVCGMQEELDVIWEHLLPAFADAPLPADPAGLARLREAEHGQRFDLGPAGAPSPALPFGETRRFACAPNPFGLVSLALSQDAGGAALEFGFGDGLVDVFRAGYAAPRASQLRRLASGHSFGAFARAAWTAPGKLQLKAAVPCSTSFFMMELDLAAPSFRSRTPIWFAHPWLEDVAVPLASPAPEPAPASP